MAILVSPGINISEIDLTQIVPAVSTTDAAIAGVFRWGPVNTPTLVTSEADLVAQFGQPEASGRTVTPQWTNSETWFTARNFLAYSNSLFVTRVVASPDGPDDDPDTYATPAHETKRAISTLFNAKYVGKLGNSLRTSYCKRDSFDPVPRFETFTIAAQATVGEVKGFVVADTGVPATDLASAVTLAKATIGSEGDNVLLNTGAVLEILSVGDATVDGIAATGGAGVGTTGDTADAAVVVVATNSVVTATAHDFVTGERVKYSNASGTDIGGLTNDDQYWVTVVNDTTIQLRNTHNSSTVVPLTAGVGSSHTFTRVTTYKAFVTFTTKYNTSAEAYSGKAYSTQWGDADLFDVKPIADSIHLVVRDNDGAISGLAGTILETYSDVSWIDGRLNEDSSTNYITDRLEQQSNWIQCTDAQADLISAGGITYDSITDMAAGTDGMDEANMRIGDMALGYDTFADKTQLDISFVLQGKPRGTVLANYIIDNICEVRKDCVAFISPELTDMTAQLIVSFAGQINASNYAFIDSGYKYQLDKYADRYRWVPLNGDIAGLCARTDDERDPWFSPAGYQRGEIKNATKLRFNANQSQRDLMYKANVNPVISRPGTGGGHILFGDKTNAGIASAFDRINVRRLFIVLEKSIEVAAKATLFEFNDEFTRAQFKNMIEPFLRDVQGRRGIYDFMVVADETNNTPEVIDSNRFVGDIYIKPVRSINFIQLNFVAVRSGVEFSEVVGNF